MTTNPIEAPSSEWTLVKKSRVDSLWRRSDGERYWYVVVGPDATPRPYPDTHGYPSVAVAYQWGGGRNR